MRNVFEAILECGHDEDFNPAESSEFRETDAPAGSRAKIDILAERRDAWPAPLASRGSHGLQRSDRQFPSSGLAAAGLFCEPL